MQWMAKHLKREKASDYIEDTMMMSAIPASLTLGLNSFIYLVSKVEVLKFQNLSSTCWEYQLILFFFFFWAKEKRDKTELGIR